MQRQGNFSSKDIPASHQQQDGGPPQRAARRLAPARSAYFLSTLTVNSIGPAVTPPPLAVAFALWSFSTLASSAALTPSFVAVAPWSIFLSSSTVTPLGRS